MKHSSALVSVDSQSKAKDSGFDTALLHSGGGIISECSWANFICIAENGTLLTNSSDSLPGITLKLLGDLQHVHNDPPLLSTVLSGRFKGALISQATSGIVPVTQIGDWEIPDEGVQNARKIASMFEKAIIDKQLPHTFLVA